MSETYGYASQVGRWIGSIPLPESERSPIAGIRHVLRLARALIDPLHRISKMTISWAEYDAEEHEQAFHEHEDYAVTGWDQILDKLDELRGRTPNSFAVESLFVELSTRVVEVDDEVWIPRSATLSLAIMRPELHPETIEVGYVTYIDAWLSTTYGDGYTARDNRAICRLNRPALHELLACFRALTIDGVLEVDKSDLYPFAVTKEGFVDADDLPRSRQPVVDR